MPGVVYEDDYNDPVKLGREDPCPIEGSELCYWLAEGNCDTCYAARIKMAEDRERMLKNWRVTLSNLPKEFDDLGNSDTCVLTKGEPVKADCYASTYMAHPDPPAKKGIILGFGKKVRIPVGSMVNLHMAISKKCRNRFRLMSLIDILMVLVLGAGAAVAVFTPAFASLFTNGAIHFIIGLLIVIGAGVAGYYLGRKLRSVLREKYSKEMRVDLREVPVIAEMMDRGWFFYDNSRGGKGDPARLELFFDRKKDFKNIFPPEDFSVDSKKSE